MRFALLGRELGDHRHPLGEVTTAAAAIGDHRELGAGRFVQHGDHRTTASRSPRADAGRYLVPVQLGDHRTREPLTTADSARSPPPPPRSATTASSAPAATTATREPLTTSSRASWPTWATCSARRSATTASS